jgi:hypothetical protein
MLQNQKAVHEQQMLATKELGRYLADAIAKSKA